MSLIIWGTSCLLAFGLLTLIAAVLIGRKVVLPGVEKHIPVLTLGNTTVTLQRTPETAMSGEYGLWVDGGGLHLKVGEEIDAPGLAADQIERHIIEKTRISSCKAGTTVQGRWTGHVYPTPSAISDTYEQLEIQLPGGIGPAWLFKPAESSTTTWAIHIHGIRTTRVTALRTVPAALLLGYSSLVPSFREDGEGPSSGNNASMLGQEEWIDVDASLRFAIENGATRIVIFGWSMGAEIALQLVERSTHSHLIAALVLIAPVTDWKQTMRHSAQKMGLPSAVSKLGEWSLSSKILSSIVGIPRPIDFESLDWSEPGRLKVPALVLHSVNDPVVPFSSSEKFVEGNPELSSLVSFPGVEHAWEFNADSQRFNAEITSWIEHVLK